jgi:hypothetical protein
MPASATEDVLMVGGESLDPEQRIHDGPDLSRYVDAAQLLREEPVELHIDPRLVWPEHGGEIA